MKLRILDGVALTLWVGSLWTIGYLAVPILFQAQPDKQLAGMLAGEMFRVQGFVGIACGVYLLLRDGVKFGKLSLRQPAFLAIALMLLITLALQFGIQPLMAGLKSQALPLEVMNSSLASNFSMWHGISSILYLIESLLGLSSVYLFLRNNLVH
ncbi:MAG: DUF4149 domain-containing protein [Gammaproteobacteria bacterium]|nr:DUF4149 domain-containing protein [Gammaproteobacteria bacterium]MBU1625215.1 DUF4149 domain-containing protein [Gammaproteobacteria bacterium]MBU1981475.1 DUF4149 domain-containing protein [Gammaproteobacteria bacterium]